MSPNNQEHVVEIDRALIELLRSLTKQSHTEIICQLFELVEDSYAKICRTDYKPHWTTKKVVYPSTPVHLGTKTRFSSSWKSGSAVSTFTLYKNKAVRFTAQQVHDMMVETILLGYKGDLDE